MNEVTSAKRFALRGDRLARWDQMQIGRVRGDLLARNRGLAFVFVKKEARSLRDFEAVEDSLVRHRAPSHGQIDRDKSGSAIVTINFLAQDTGIERKMREWFELEFPMREKGFIRRRVGLQRVPGHEHARRVSDRGIKPMVRVPAEHQRCDERKRFQGWPSFAADSVLAS